MLASAILVALSGFAVNVHALSLGAISVKSSLGEPLRAEIEIPQMTSEEAESFRASVGSPQAFRAAGIEYGPAIPGTRVTIHQRSNGQTYLRVVGVRPINEPFMGLVVESSWATGRMVRDYTMLIDPPRQAPAQVVVTPSQVAAPTLPRAKSLEPSYEPPVRAPRAEVTPRSRAAAHRANTVPMAPIAAGGGTQVRVQRGDTANSIAVSNLPDGVSLDQMLVAMLRTNPDAFIRGNVNRIRAGAVLQLPSAEQALAMSPPQAKRALVARSKDFQAYRRGLAQGAQRNRVAAADRSAAGTMQTQVREVRPSAASQDKLTLSRGGTSTSEAEMKAAQSRQAKEQNDRVAELSKNIDELTRLQSASGKAAGSSAPSASTAGIAVNPPIAVPASATAPASAAAVATPATAASAPASDMASALPASAASAAQEPASTPVAEASKPAPAASAPRVTRAPAPAPVEESSWLDWFTDNPLLPIGLLAALGLGGYGLQRAMKRRKSNALDSSLSESRLQPDSFFGAPGGQRVDTGEVATNVSTGFTSMTYAPSQLDAAGDVDPVAEADVYLAYGRDVQAEEILKEALRTYPERTSLHRKLGEIYAKRRDTLALQAIATEAYAVSKGEGTDWEAITQLGRELDPANTLYQPGGRPAEKTVAEVHPFGADTQPFTPMLETLAPAPARPDGLDLDLDLGHEDLDLPEDFGPSVQPVDLTAIAASTRSAPLTPNSDLPVSTAAKSAPGTIDFDPPAAELKPRAVSAPARAIPPSAASAAAPVSPRASAPASSAGPNSGMIEFDLSELSPAPAARPAASADRVAAPVAAHSDDLLTRQPDAQHTQQPDDAEDDPLSTKLALAEEFHAIGDSDGARMLAKEVVASASGALKARAERFLNELG